MAKNLVFTIEAEHVEIAQKWIASHPCSLRGQEIKTAIGGQISYEFVNTAIGQLQNIRCACGASTCINGQDL